MATHDDRPTLAFHGAAGTVTGSCYELCAGPSRILVDCGLFQGPRSLEALNFAPFDFDLAQIDAVIVTHAHLDHSGLLPRLAAQGYKGPVWCTPATGDLLTFLLADAARLAEQDAERRNRRHDRADEPPIEPLYTTSDVARLLKQVRTADFGPVFTPCTAVEARFWDAGHVLGSASVEITLAGVRVLFSGDIGSASSGLLDDPEGPALLDHLIIEATYGDRERPRISVEQRRAELKREVGTALARGGNLLIPAFALERTQELLLDLATLLNRGELPHRATFIDSPLASKVTGVFQRYEDQLAGLDHGEVFRHPAFHFTEDVAQSRALENMTGAIIIAGSGMCEGGRMRHHLVNNLPRSDSTLLFVGYQAAGTLGRTILDGAHRVRVSGEDVAVRLRVREIGSYSAHADRRELLAWAAARRPIAGTVFVTHGEPAALDSLGKALEATGDTVRVPELGEKYELPQGAGAHRLKTGRAELRDILSRDWQNDYADLAVNLKRDLARLESNRQRREAVARMREVLTSYHKAKAQDE